ncbi:MAG: hypothetical protein EA396_09480 [Anaerolineaceae bacterium]|nr:MAG: hypothetical protein EA396_09480 [Anaerolineaceae bacterium]
MNEAHWPRIMRVAAHHVLYAVSGLLVLAWILFFVIYIFGWLNYPDGQDTGLFDRDLFEWSQWALMAFTVFWSGFISASLFAEGRPLTARFFLMMAFAFGFFLIDITGNIGLAVNLRVRVIFDDGVAGVLSPIVLITYFTLLASLPIFALTFYGKYVRQSSSARRYLAIGVPLYVVGVIAGFIQLFLQVYFDSLDWANTSLLAGGFPVWFRENVDTYRLWLIDSPAQDTIEFFGLALIVAAILAFAADFRAGRLPASETEPQSEAAA